MADTIGILMMAYGTPASLEEVESYYTHIRHGRPPTSEQLSDLIRRYQTIGGLSPLNELTRQQALLLEAALQASDVGRPVRVYIGMKHCHPFIADAVQRMVADGVSRAVGIVLAPHFSAMSVGDYISTAEKAAAAHGMRGLSFVHSWHMERSFLRAVTDRVSHAWSGATSTVQGSVKLLFTAHSLPQRIIAQHDPYPQQLLDSSRAVANAAGLSDWQFAWQSAGKTPEPWLTPDILDVLDDLKALGYRGVVCCPIGFVSDHLEILYDLDVAASARANSSGMQFARTPSLNTDPGLIQALAAAVMRELKR